MKDNKTPQGFSRTFLLFYQVLIILGIPVFFIIHLRQMAPMSRFCERLGICLGHSKTFQNDKPTIWFHAASLGEVKQIHRVAQRMKDEHGFNVFITTFTQAGAEWVAQNLPFAVHKFAPVDSGLFVERFLRKFKPQQLVIVEGDIWPILLNATRRKHIPISLINARSSKSRKRFPKFHANAASYFKLITCPTDAIHSEFRALGMDPTRIKFAASLKTSELTIDDELSAAIKKLANGREILTFASTHPSDEDLLMDVLGKLQKEPRSYFFIWAPRHMRRLAAISQRLADLEIDFSKRTDLPTPIPQPDLLILDTLGELSTALATSSAVYLGGGLGKEGGHNPFEPAYFGLPIATGPKVENHQQAFDILSGFGAVDFVEEAGDLVRFLTANHDSNPKLTELVQKRLNIGVDETTKLLSQI